MKGSQTTGQPSSTPKRSASSARSSSVVTGVMRSTMEFGKRTFSLTHLPSSGSRIAAKAEKLLLAMWPLPWMLSQETIANGGIPRSRRRTSASVTRPNVVRGTAPGCASCRTPGSSSSKRPVTAWKLYPPSVTVSETIRVAGSAMRSITASGSSGANRYSRMDPITRGSSVPSGCFTTRV